MISRASIILDLGCGTRKTPGAIGADRIPTAGVDVVCDLDAGLPFADNSVEAVVLNHVVEHVDDLCAAMQEVWRVCRPGATVRIWTPHFSSGLTSWSDPTHKRTCTSRTFAYFAPENNSHYARARFHIQTLRLHYKLGGAKQASPKLRHWLDFQLGRLLERWANRNRINIERAERFVSRLIPFDELYVELRAEKNSAASGPQP